MSTPTKPKHRLHPRIAGALTLTALALCALAPATAAAKPKPKPLYWGAVIGKQLTGEAAPWDFSAVEAFERKARKNLSLLAFSSPFADCGYPPCTAFPFPTAAMETLRQRGTIPFLSWASQSVPTTLDQPDFRLAAIARGDHDDYIEDFAEGAVEWGRPFFLRFNAEMNGFWFPWSEGVNGNRASQYIAAWRHVHDIFTRLGATNATWVWCPNVDFTKNLTPLEKLYPGGDYVDWTCLDGFNWGKTRNSAGWMSFNEVFKDTYKRVVKIAPNKPMVIGETASEERGGSKAAWIEQTLKVIPAKYRKVRALIWFDEKDQGMHWPIESSPASERAFARAISRKIYRPNVFSELPPGPVMPPGRELAAGG